MSAISQHAHEVRVRALHADAQAFVDRFPDDAMGLGCLISRKLNRCDWKDLDHYIERLRHVIKTTDQCCEPVFNLIGTTQEEQYVNMQRYVQWRFGNEHIQRKKQKRSEKIRIGYLSSDFHEHATCYLMASLFEHHSLERFELYAFSCGPDDHSPMRGRIKENAYRFVECHSRSPMEAAQEVKDANLDILVDLKGWTQGNCNDILAEIRKDENRPAIVHYLGYPCTTGGMCDYILADPIVIPPENRPFFSEEVIYLPGSYQINDDRCEIGETLPRAEYGLPETGEVFGSFNQPYKITAWLWANWMETLRATPDSVLWQYINHEEAYEMLCEHARARDIDPKRIIGAKHVNRPAHLARLRHVTACFDTSPVCGHTTSSDALRMGLKPIFDGVQPKTFIGQVTNSLISNEATLWDAAAKTRQIEAAYEEILNA